MLQILLNALRRLAERCDLSEAERWRADPLSHPALKRMSQTELGDLPIGHPVLPRRLTEGRC